VPHLTLVVPTLNRYDRLEAMLDSVSASTVKPDQIIVIDNGRKLLYKPFLFRHNNIDIYIPQTNLGVAGSCNQALRMVKDWWFHCNDDVELESTLIEKMKAAIEAVGDTPLIGEPVMYIPDYGVGSAFSVFMMHKRIIGDIGWWDEAFFPIYHEDCDFGYRMNLAGVKRKVVEGCTYHHHTSSTIKGLPPDQMEAHHQNFRKLRAYYEAKWGGPPEGERFSIPFDGGSVIEVDKQWWSRFGREG
jgi:GT2 family glycosyltransferase